MNRRKQRLQRPLLPQRSPVQFKTRRELRRARHVVCFITFSMMVTRWIDQEQKTQWQGE